jgi:hypothetical protein
MLTKSDKRYEEDKILWRQMIIGFCRLHLNIPTETSYHTEERFQGWYGKDGVITHIMGQFGLVEKSDRRRIKRVLVNVKEWASRGVLYKGLRLKDQGRKPMIYSPQEYQILIDSMESGYGLITAIKQINE